MSESLAVVAVLVPLLLILLIGPFVIALARIQATVARMEAATLAVADDLAATAKDLRVAALSRTATTDALDRMEAAAEVVASNLAASVARADAMTGKDGNADATPRTGDAGA